MNTLYYKCIILNSLRILLWFSVHTFEYFYKCNKKKNIYVSLSFETLRNLEKDIKSTAEIPAVHRHPFLSIIHEKFGAKVYRVASITRRTHHFDRKRQAVSTSIRGIQQVKCMSKYSNKYSLKNKVYSTVYVQVYDSDDKQFQCSRQGQAG